MIRHHILDSVAEVDEDATKAWYESADAWRCECGGCQNFLEVAKQGLLPAPVQTALDRFAIPGEKATYVCHICQEGQWHLYEFCYRIAGNILSSLGERPFGDWGEGYCGHDSYPYGAPDFPTPHFDMIFFAKLPWVLPFKMEG